MDAFGYCHTTIIAHVIFRCHFILFSFLGLFLRVCCELTNLHSNCSFICIVLSYSNSILVIYQLMVVRYCNSPNLAENEMCVKY